MVDPHESFSPTPLDGAPELPAPYALLARWLELSDPQLVEGYLHQHAHQLRDPAVIAMLDRWIAQAPDPLATAWSRRRAQLLA